ncbi:UDP-glucose 4-epimerase GalE [Indioceanicola profundi]|uniref:UDP-glucose 4-epimerase GalE n=1 Tax=Indioceanicola profundi TaxID=2220096 RepID=UPI000E6AC471|nr:UDP-glucose 4-epimerase GalE [Indioceanicola profundi]
MENGTVLVTGGAGYIGSHAALALLDGGWNVVVLDNLCTGRRHLVPDRASFVEGDVADQNLVSSLLTGRRIDAVMHFAGSVVVPESVADPLKYYANNTSATRSLIGCCVEAGVERMIFSSTAAVYGTPDTRMVDEGAPTRPISPYGRSKLMSEWMLEDVARAHPFRFTALRYFNVAGADPEGRSGQATPNATHLIKVACEVAAGKRTGFDIFGTDYDTPDGTCVRDYIHVADLAAAHVQALERLMAGGESIIMNCGYGRGYSVREVVAAVERGSGRSIHAAAGDRRPGDPVALVADNRRIREVLGWTPKHDDLDFIVRTALDWELKEAA